ncbi:MAG TPA: lamin tail domain-containing protein, partial [Solirubrobacteraceae bacterium]|nr:lamin tail domain-containing protein [Solirubrobacteraceae bacterium]
MPFRPRTTATAVALAALALSAPSASALQISELRLQGINGANDEFVEIFNETAAPVTVEGANGGYAVVASDGLTRFVIPNGTVIPPGGHYLAANSVGYSQATHASPDTTYTLDIEHDDGVALFQTADPAFFNADHKLDAFGFIDDDPLYREGDGFPIPTGYSVNMAFLRDLRGGAPEDTGDNAADFRVPDTNGTSLIQTNPEYQLLGVPGPQNTHSPAAGIGGLEVSLLDPSAPATAAPNTVRDATAQPAESSTHGTVVLRRRITNRTGQPITRLRFRVADLTTYPVPGGTADLRARTIGQTVVTVGGEPRTVKGTTLEAAASQPNRGGVNASLSVPTVSQLSPLGPGESIDVQFLVGLQSTGDYRICLHSESRPIATGALVAQAGDTQDASNADPGCGAPSAGAAVAEVFEAQEEEEEEETPQDVAPTGEPAPAPQTQPEPQPQPRPQGDTTAPRFLNGLALSRRVFTAGRWGTKVSFTLDEPAKVALRVEHGRTLLPGTIVVNAERG